MSLSMWQNLLLLEPLTLRETRLKFHETNNMLVRNVRRINATANWSEGSEASLNSSDNYNAVYCETYEENEIMRSN